MIDVFKQLKIVLIRVINVHLDQDFEKVKEKQRKDHIFLEMPLARNE